jgi:arabinose-5-phosphate isomerase
VTGPAISSFEVVGNLIRDRRSIWTGVGKSGYAAQLLAATGATSGLATNFVHAEDLLHGELSTLRDDDALIVLSWSGKSGQLRELFRGAPFTTVLLTAAQPTEMGITADHFVVCDDVVDEILDGIPCESILEMLRVGYQLIAAATTAAERVAALQSGHLRGSLSIQLR